MFSSSDDFWFVLQSDPVDGTENVAEEKQADGGVSEVGHVKVMILVVSSLNYHSVKMVEYNHNI